MVVEPHKKKVIAFIDGQNLFHGIKEAFGYKYPNYDIKLLVEKICSEQNWSLEEINFYTGVPDEIDNRFWYTFWTNKLSVMGRQKIKIFSRSLKYRNQTIKLPDNSEHTFLVGQEKGIDIRIALDAIKIALKNTCNIILIFSQDQDLSEVADEIRTISQDQKRWIKIASCFPISPAYDNKRGINKTDWIKFDKKLYELCIDKNDYRPKTKPLSK